MTATSLLDLSQPEFIVGISSWGSGIDWNTSGEGRLYTEVLADASWETCYANGYYEAHVIHMPSGTAITDPDDLTEEQRAAVEARSLFRTHQHQVLFWSGSNMSRNPWLSRIKQGGSRYPEAMCIHHLTKALALYDWWNAFCLAQYGEVTHHIRSEDPEVAAYRKHPDYAAWVEYIAKFPPNEEGMLSRYPGLDLRKGVA